MIAAKQQPIALPANSHVFHMLGIQVTNRDLAHLHKHLPSDDQLHGAVIVCEYVKHWRKAMTSAVNRDNAQSLGRYAANRWLTMGGHNSIS